MMPLNAWKIEDWRRLRIERDRLNSLRGWLLLAALLLTSLLLLSAYDWMKRAALVGILLCGATWIAAWFALLSVRCPECGLFFYWNFRSGGSLAYWFGACSHCGSVIPSRAQFEQYDRAQGTSPAKPG